MGFATGREKNLERKSKGLREKDRDTEDEVKGSASPPAVAGGLGTFEIR